MKICTLAIGDKYIDLANKLKESLPFELHIFDEKKIPAGYCIFKNNFFNYNCKRHVLLDDKETEFLFVDADSICHKKDKFLDFYTTTECMTPGVYSTYTWSSYGFHVPKIKENVLDKSLLKEKVVLFNELLKFTDEQLLKLQAPGEWILFYKFENTQQKNNFYKMWGLLENKLLSSDIKYLGAECFSIAMSAIYCDLPVCRFGKDIGIKHK